MVHFPDTPSFTGFNTPSRIEADIRDLAHEGEIPKEINGAFYRVQPDPQFPPMLGDDIAFNGDGMITRFHIHDGQCDFRQRWAKTDKWKAEREAGRGLFGMYRNPLTDDASTKGMIRSTANTNAWIYAGKLWAMKEDSPALLMDPVSMESEAFEKFDGKMKGQTFTAHPEDRSEDRQYGRNRLCRFRPVHRRCRLLRSESGRRVDPRSVVQGSLLLHDARFRDHRGLPRASRRAVDRQLGTGWRRSFRISASTPPCRSISASFPGATDLKQEDIRWFKRDNCFASHVLNAWQEGSKVHFVVPEAKNNMFPFFPDVHGEPFNGMEAMSKLTRWTVDMASNGEEFDSITPLTETASEFPRIDDRFTGVKNRYGWGLEMDMRRPGRTEGRQRRRLPDELPVPQGSRNRQRAALVVRAGVEPAGTLLHTAPQRCARGRWLDRDDLQPVGRPS